MGEGKAESFILYCMPRPANWLAGGVGRKACNLCKEEPLCFWAEDHETSETSGTAVMRSYIPFLPYD